MGLIEHWPMVLLLAVIMLVVLGPRKMIEMGQRLAKVARETVAAMREVDWAALTRDDEQPKPTTGPTRGPASPVAPPPPARVVEGSAEPERPTEPPRA